MLQDAGIMLIVYAGLHIALSCCNLHHNMKLGLSRKRTA